MEPLNLTYLHSLSGGDAAFEQKLIDIIKKEYPLEKALFYENFEKGNFKLASGTVHKIKHKISILGLEKSYATATLFENNLLENNTSLSEAFSLILNNITHALTEL